MSPDVEEILERKVKAKLKGWSAQTFETWWVVMTSGMQLEDAMIEADDDPVLAASLLAERMKVRRSRAKRSSTADVIAPKGESGSRAWQYALSYTVAEEVRSADETSSLRAALLRDGKLLSRANGFAAVTAWAETVAGDLEVVRVETDQQGRRVHRIDRLDLPSGASQPIPPASVLEVLKNATAAWTNRYGWQEAQGVAFALCDVVPLVPVLTIQTSTWHERAPIRMRVHPLVPPAEVADAFLQARREQLEQMRGSARVKLPIDRTCEMVWFSIQTGGGWDHIYRKWRERPEFDGKPGSADSMRRMVERTKSQLRDTIP